MSGLLKGIKKVFKKVVKVVKKLAPIVLAAAAIYFTAGMALSAMPATSAFAASMPGFAGGGIAGLGIGSGATAGTGVFSHLAATLGMGSGLASGAMQGGSILGAQAATASQLAATGFSQAAIGGAAAVDGATAISQAGGLTGSLSTGAGAGGVNVAAGAAAKMSIADKLLLASTVTNTASALLAPSERELRKWQGSFYGVDSKGRGGPAPVPTPGAPMQPSAAPAAQKPGQMDSTGMQLQLPQQKAKPMQLIGPQDPSAANPYMLADSSQQQQARLIQ